MVWWGGSRSITATQRVGAFIEDVWNAPDGATRLAAHLAPTYTEHAYGGGAEGLAAALTELREGFPDATFEIEDMMQDGDRVAVRLHMRATHLGLFRGQAPTRRRVSVKLMRWYRLEADKIAEHWAVFDTASLRRQISA